MSNNVHDITDTLADSATLAEMARRAGITLAQARAVAAMFADLGVDRTTRICVEAQHGRIRQSARDARKAKR